MAAVAGTSRSGGPASSGVGEWEEEGAGETRCLRCHLACFFFLLARNSGSVEDELSGEEERSLFFPAVFPFSSPSDPDSHLRLFSLGGGFPPLHCPLPGRLAFSAIQRTWEAGGLGLSWIWAGSRMAGMAWRRVRAGEASMRRAGGRGAGAASVRRAAGAASGPASPSVTGTHSPGCWKSSDCPRSSAHSPSALMRARVGPGCCCSKAHRFPSSTDLALPPKVYQIWTPWEWVAQISTSVT